MRGIKIIAITLVLTSLLTSVNVSYASEPEMMAEASVTIPNVSLETGI